MHSNLSIIGEIFSVVPHNSDWCKVAAILRDNPEELVMIPRGDKIMVTNVLNFQHSETGWCHAMYDGKIIEIATDLLVRLE